MRPKRRGLPALIIGLVMWLVVAPAVALVVGFVAFDHGLSRIDQASGLMSQDSHHVDAKQTVTVFVGRGKAEDGGTWITSADVAAPDGLCTVTGPSGTDVPLFPSTGPIISRGGVSYESAGTFTAPQAGSYLIECSGRHALVFDASAPGDLWTHTFDGIVVGVLVASAIGLIGIVVVVVGIVLLVRSRHRIRDFDRWQMGRGFAVPGAVPYGPPGAYGYPPPAGHHPPTTARGPQPPPDDPYRAP